MKIGDLNLMAQLLESVDLAVKELEKSIETRNIEKLNRSKEEILNFHKEIKKLLG